MQHDEAIVLVVALGNDVCQLHPQRRRHVARVDGRVELVGGNLRLKLFQLRHPVQQVLEVEGLKGPRQRVTVHADGPAGVDEQYFALHSW